MIQDKLCTFRVAQPKKRTDVVFGHVVPSLCIPLLNLISIVLLLYGDNNMCFQGEGDEEQYYLAPSARAMVVHKAVKAQVQYQC
jgi:hypothetical protein